MSCGRDLSILKELRAQHAAMQDLLSIGQSKLLLSHINLDIWENLLAPLLKEQHNLEEKLTMYLTLSNIVLKSIISHIRISHEMDEETRERFSSLRKLDEAYGIVRKKQDELNRKKDQLDDLVDEMEAKWNEEKLPDGTDSRTKEELMRMSKEERKELVNMWRDREKIGFQGWSAYEDLKIECLRGIASLKESS